MVEQPKRALITGVNSFTGFYLRQELERHGWEVWGTALNLDSDNPRYRQMDLCETNRMRIFIEEIQPTAIIHLAAISFVAEQDVDNIYKVNLLGSRKLMAAIVQSGANPEAVLLVSSAQVYGAGHSGSLSETAETRPASDYAVSKLAMEHMARMWAEKLPIIITRPFNYTGRGQNVNFVIPKIVDHFIRRAPFIELGNVDVWRDFSDVRMVARAYRRLLEKKAVGETVNICSGMTHSLREILAMAENITGHAMEVRINPAFARDNEVTELSGDISLLDQLVGGWRPIPLEDTLAWMLSSSQ